MAEKINMQEHRQRRIYRRHLQGESQARSKYTYCTL